MSKRTHVRVRQNCAFCGGLIARDSRRGLLTTCPLCGTVQAGPGLPTPPAQPIKALRKRKQEPPAPVEPPPRRTRWLFGGRS